MNAEDIERAFQEIAGGHHQVGQALFGFGGGAPQVQRKFCEVWPDVEKLISNALMFGMFLPGGVAVAAEAKTVLAVIEKMFIPIACPVATPHQ